MDRFDKFTDHARRVLTLAQDESQRFHHSYIGTEHLLLGLIRDDACTGTRVLRGAGVDLPKVRLAVEFAISRADRPPQVEVGLTPSARHVIELAIDESRRMGHRYIGTEHLLLGLARESDGTAAGVLGSLGVGVDLLRHHVIRELAAPPAPSGAPDADTFAPAQWTTAIPRQPSAAEAMATLETSRLYEAVSRSDIGRVVGIGAVATVEGVAAELIALEVRAAGSILTWKVRSDWLDDVPEPTVVVSDDAGNEYAARRAGFASSGRDAKGETLVVPPPLDGALALRVVLAAGDRRWEFTVHLVR